MPYIQGLELSGHDLQVPSPSSLFNHCLPFIFFVLTVTQLVLNMEPLALLNMKKRIFYALLQVHNVHSDLY